MPMIVVCTPSHDERVALPFLYGMMALGAEAATHGVEIGFFGLGGWSDVAMARDVCAAAFLRSPATHLLFVDSDQGFQPRDVFAMLELDKPLIGAVYSRRELDPVGVREAALDGVAAPDLLAAGGTPCVHLTTDAECGDRFIEVRAIGMGVTLIRRDVVERLAAAHPELAYTLPAGLDPRLGESTIAGLFQPIIRDNGRLGEDASFCARWRELGGRVFAYLTTDVTHHGTFSYRCSPRTLVALREQALAQRNAP